MRPVQHTLVFLVAGLSLLGTASARDTSVARLHRIDDKAVAALQKAKITATKQLRERFSGWSPDRIQRWGRSKGLDPEVFLALVRQADLLAARPLSPIHAHLLVSECSVTGLAKLAKQQAEALQPCVKRHSAAYGLTPAPTVDEVGSWIEGAKNARNVQETITWANKVPINRFFKRNAEIAKALTRKGWTDNLAVHENLSLASERETFARRNRLDPEEVRRYLTYADLLRLEAISPRLAHLLHLGGVKGLAQLKGHRAPILTAKLGEANRKHRVLPKNLTEAEVSSLIEGAEPFKQH